MATSKYGAGKYGFRLYSAVSFRNFSAIVPISVQTNGDIVVRNSFSLAGSINIDVSAFVQIWKSLYCAGLVSVNANAELFVAHTHKLRGVANINIDVQANLSSKVYLATKSSIVVGGTANAYLGPVWNEKDCNKGGWSGKRCGISTWHSTLVKVPEWSRRVDG